MTLDGDLFLIIDGLRTQVTDLKDALQRSNMDYELLSRGIARQWPHSPLLRPENMETHHDCDRWDIALMPSDREFLSVIRAPEDIGALALAPRRVTMHRMSAHLEHTRYPSGDGTERERLHHWIRAGKDNLTHVYLSDGLLLERERYPFIQQAIYRELLKVPVK